MATLSLLRADFPMATATSENRSKTVDGYLAIPVNSLIVDQCAGIGLFIRNPEGDGVRLYKSSELPIETSDLQRLAARDIHSLYIRKGDYDAYQEYLKENLANVMQDESLPVANRFGALSQVVRDVMMSSFLSGDAENVVEQSSQMADHCAALLSRDDYTPTDLLQVLHHDFHTFTHSTNVSVMSAMLARALGIESEEDIRQITVGGLIHDLGKLEIPPHILTKPGKLTDAEYDIVRGHPTSGLLKLRGREDLTEGQLMMVYQHHEEVAGGGYPVGCPASQIHDWALICKVVDVYEALVADRPYRGPLPREQVVEIMERQSGVAFDKEILKCWLATTTKQS